MLFEIQLAQVDDAEEILALQKLAFKTEAEIYQDYSIQPLTQTLAELQAEFSHCCILKAVTDNECIVGSVRAEQKADTCYINRLMVHPDYRRQGWGKALMTAIEEKFPVAKHFQLGTGTKSINNLNMYRKMGYEDKGIEPVNDRISFVILVKTKTKA